MRPIQLDDIIGCVRIFVVETECGRCQNLADWEVSTYQSLIEEMTHEGWIYDEESKTFLCGECAEHGTIGHQTTDEDFEGASTVGCGCGGGDH